VLDILIALTLDQRVAEAFEVGGGELLERERVGAAGLGWARGGNSGGERTLLL